VCWGRAPGQSRKLQEANKRSTPRIVNAFKHQLEARMPKGVMERYAAIFGEAMPRLFLDERRSCDLSQARYLRISSGAVRKLSDA